MAMVPQSSEPRWCDPRGVSRDAGNLWQRDLGATQIELGIKQKLGTLRVLHWFLINLLQSWS